MKLLQFTTILVLSSILTSAYGQSPIPFTDKRWTIQAQGQMMEPYKGKNSIYLQNGMALLPDANFLDGIIEFDIYLSYQTSFSGFVFRLVDANNYEELYLRAQQSGYPDAFQYTPTFNNDAGWQLYHDQHDGVNDGFISWKQRGKNMGYNTTTTFSYDRWMHVKMLVKGTQAEFYLDDMEHPVAFIRELKMSAKAGGVGIKSGIGAAHFADFSYRSAIVEFKTKDDGYHPVALPNTVMQWLVSTPFKENQLKGAAPLDNKWLNTFSWKQLDAESSGLTNLSRISGIVDSANTVFAKLTVQSDKDELRALDFGYSDRVKIYCNRNPIYSGNTSFRTRDFRHLGTIGWYDVVYVPLKKGANTILFAVSETFGGWGIMAHWE
jgi:hypothetical protein